MKLEQRRSPRLKDYDYSQAGAYYVTICVKDRRKMFGDVVDDTVCLSAAGEIAQAAWNCLPDRFPNIELDAYVILPNHFHGIMVIKEAASMYAENNQHTLGDIIGIFKGLASYKIHKQGTKEFTGNKNIGIPLFVPKSIWTLCVNILPITLPSGPSTNYACKGRR